MLAEVLFVSTLSKLVKNYMLAKFGISVFVIYALYAYPFSTVFYEMWHIRYSCEL